MMSKVSFEGVEISAYQWRGERVFLVGDVSTLLGYNRRSTLASKFTTTEEVVEGLHYHRLRGAELRMFKEAAGPGLSPAAKHAHGNVIVVTDRGFGLACVLARGTFGRRFRDWLSSAIEDTFRAAIGEGAEVQA